ncbi:MAG: hypothetical protein LBT14_02590 [Treponema sp.]|nr:hypothetical protein [Treponema sp.]
MKKYSILLFSMVCILGLSGKDALAILLFSPAESARTARPVRNCSRLIRI